MILTGEKLNFLLSINHKTGKDLSQFLGIKHVSISRWIHDVRPIPKRHYKKIAEFFDIPLNDLANDIPSQEKDIYDIIKNLSMTERLNLIVYLANSINTLSIRME